MLRVILVELVYYIRVNIYNSDRLGLIWFGRTRREVSGGTGLALLIARR